MAENVADTRLDVQLNVHECLRISEIRAEIFNTLQPADCAVLARTCKLFHHEAMDAVWADLQSLLPLVRCMPLDLLDEAIVLYPDGWGMRPRGSGKRVEISFKRVPTEDDWRRFCKNAHRVKSLRLPHNQILHALITGQSSVYANHSLTDEAMVTLVTFIRDSLTPDKPGQSRCLFPRLVSLRVTTGEHVWFPNYVESLCGATLQSFVLDYDRATFHAGDTRVYGRLVDILPTFQSIWPNLRSVRLVEQFFLTNARQDTTFAHKLDAWLSGIARLQSLRVQLPMQSSIVRTISQLPELCDLRFVGEPNGPHDDDMPVQLSPPCFPSLQRFHLTVYYPDSPMVLLRALTAPTPIHTLTIRNMSQADDPGLSQCVTDMFEAISHLPTLKYLDLQVKENSYSEWDPLYEFSLSGKLLSLLHSLRQLKRIKLSGFPVSSLRDSDLINAAAAWPDLENLQFHVEDLQDGTTQPPDTTLAGIQALYNGCPNLKEVFLAVNDSIPMTDGILDIPPAKPHCVMEDLTLNFRADNDQALQQGSDEYIAMLVRLMFPELKNFAPWTFDANVRDWDGSTVRNWITYRKMEPADVRSLLERRIQVRDEHKAGRA